MYRLKCNSLMTLVWLSAVVVLIPGVAPAEAPSKVRLDRKWVFITSPLKWVGPSKDPELPKYKIAEGCLAVLYPSGEFVEGEFSVGRYKNGAMFILPGEGFALRRGHWSRDGDRLTVRARWTYREKVVALPGSTDLPSEETWIARGKAKGRMGGRLVAPSQNYIPLSGLENFEELDRIIKDSP